MDDYEEERELSRMGLPCRLRDDAKWVDPSRRLTKQEAPYSYSEFFIFGDRITIKKPGTRADYSDRLRQWDYRKFEKLWEEHVGCRWDQASRSQLSAFISAYHGMKFSAVALAEGCNVGNGYPYWIIWYCEEKGKKET